MRARTARFLAAFQALLLMGTLVLPALATATTWTDRPDYSPGSVVTISGDNSDGAGWLAAEAVNVAVSGPNAYSASCKATVDAVGAWSCQVTLWADDLAEGQYDYVSTGLTSGVVQYGGFSDNIGVSFATPNPAFVWHRNGEVGTGFDVTASGSYVCTTGGSAANHCSSVSAVNITVTGAVGSKAATITNGFGSGDWSATLQFRTSGGNFALPLTDGRYSVVATMDGNQSASDPTATNTNYFGIDNTAPSSTISCNSAACVGPYSADVTVRLTGTDPNGSNGSGFASGLYCTDTTDTCTPDTAYPNSSGFNLPRVSGETYYVRYAGSDSAGNVESVKSSSVPFSTDDPAPFVTGTSPSNGATAAANADIVITFSEAVTVTPSPLWVSLTCNGGSPIAGTTTGSGTSVVTFDPTPTLASGASCTVQVQKNQVTDAGGNNPAANSSFNFFVDAAPFVTSSMPSDGATEIALTGSSITFNFSEAVNVDFITVACGTSGNHTFSRTNNGTSAVTFTLASLESYASGESCLLTLNSNNVHDVDAIDPPDLMAANYSFSFTTDATTSPSVTTITCPPSQIYTGSAIEPCTYTVTGAGGLNIGPNPVPSSGYSSNVNVGTATAAYTYPGDATHTSSSDSKTFGITKASTTTTVSCPAGPYAYTGAAQEPCSYSVTGANLALGPLAVPTDGYSDNTNAGTATAAYTYLGDTNHTGSNDTDTFVIGKADVDCTVTGYDVTYNAAAHTATGSCIGVLGETVSGLDLSPTTHTHAGDYTDSWTFTDTTGNYADTGDTVSDVIHKADSTTTVVCPAGPYVYTGSSQEPCTASWSSNGTDLEGGALTPTYADNVHAGTATASAEFLGDADHNGSNDDETFTIGQRSITVTATNQTKVLGATLTFAGTEFSITSGTMVVGESIASVTLTSAGAPAAAGVGPYPINPSAAVFSNALASDYLVSYAPGTLAVQYASTGTCLGAAGHSILQPINIDGTSVSKQGSTVPAKFRVCDAFGQSIGTPGVVTNFVLYQKIGATNETVNEVVDSTTPDTAFRWSATDQQWIFNINTKPLQKNYKYFYRVDLNDGSSIYFAFSLK